MTVGGATEGFVVAATVLFYGLPMAAFAAVVLTVAGRLTLARKITRVVTLGAPITVIFMIIAARALVEWAIISRDENRAVVLASGIAETMNVTFVAFLCVILCVANRFVISRRLEAAAQQGAAADKAAR